MSSRQICSVFGCSNTYANTTGVKFYSFPFRPWEMERRKTWIRFCKRQTNDGSDWIPNKISKICSQHFVGNVKSEHPLNPSFNPSIYPHTEEVESNATTETNASVSRFERAQKRRQANEENLSRAATANNDEIHLNIINEEPIILDDLNEVHIHAAVEASVQTEISPTSDVSIQTKTNKVSESSTQTSTINRVCVFYGYDTVKCNEAKLKSLTSVSSNAFSLLLSLLPTLDKLAINEITWENKLLMTLIKIKSDLPYSFIATMFDVSPSAVSIIFKKVLELLYYATKEWIFWPSRQAIQETMPAGFKNLHPDTRVILDCTEIFTERPSSVDKRVLMYSMYKSHFTVKYLVGVTPSGFISFLSSGYGGRATDTFITNDSGLLNKLERGDKVMADKGFPNLQMIDDTILIMPPFASKKDNFQFSSNQVSETYEIASIRIHVERIMGRLKIYKILHNTLTTDLIPYIDIIMHLCAVLVNLQPPIIKLEEDMLM